MKQLGDILIFLLLIAILAAVVAIMPLLVDYDDYRKTGGNRSIVSYLANPPREPQE